MEPVKNEVPEEGASDGGDDGSSPLLRFIEEMREIQRNYAKVTTLVQKLQTQSAEISADRFPYLVFLSLGLCLFLLLLQCVLLFRGPKQVLRMSSSRDEADFSPRNRRKLGRVRKEKIRAVPLRNLYKGQAAFAAARHKAYNSLSDI